MINKICNKCKLEKSIDDYYVDNSKKDNRHSICKECCLEAKKRFYNKNKEIILNRNRQYYLSNKKKIGQRKKEYYNENKEKINMRNKKRLNENIELKIISNYRRRFNTYFTKYRVKKIQSSLKCLGCSFKYLIEKWLPSFFDENMNYKNYGIYWEIDHIIPLYKFDLINSEEREIAFHYTNLRPLSLKDNRCKKFNVVY